MPNLDYLHNHKDFKDLLRIIGEEMGIEPGLVEKDYWIKHALFGLQKLALEFELKGGTSLSKGYHIINRFSEDIDIHIKPPAEFGINENPNNKSAKNIEARKKFFDWLATDKIKIDGLTAVRDTDFDDTKYYRNAGIRLQYDSVTEKVVGLKEGILLEAGFVVIAPFKELTISSWTYDRAAATDGISILDNRARNMKCYHPGYTFVEKLQTIATKFRKEQEDGEANKVNFMRQYYDVSCLLDQEEVLKFIGTPDYIKHKEEHFPEEDFAIPIAKNEAFLLSNKVTRDNFKSRYVQSKALYYKGQPEFDDLISKIGQHIERL
jgi:Nucleotidyl transferase AbiEii toxin, Type IV TA system